MEPENNSCEENEKKGTLCYLLYMIHEYTD